MVASASDALIGQKVGKFRIEKKLGEGGMGAVFKAVDPNLDREVALKVIRPELASQSDFLARFQREAKAVAKFKHPNAIEIYEYGDGSDTDGLVYMAFEFVRGRELRDVIREHGHLEAARATRITAQILSALERAHAQQIVHRDLKPQNVMVEAGEEETVKILDFGIAKIKSGDGSQALTQAGQIIGTVAYMSPEQSEGKPVDARSDIYSVGVMLYQMLTGKLPFNGKNAIEVIRLHRSAPVPTLKSALPEAPEALEPLLQRAMAKKVEDRYQTAREFREALESLPVGVAVPRRSTQSYKPVIDATIEVKTPASAVDSGQRETGAKAHEPTAVLPKPGAAGIEDDATRAKGASPTPHGAGYQTGATGQFFAGLEGQTIDDKYVIESKLGEGGMGAVFKARHKLLGSVVAIKIVHPGLAGEKGVRERFGREAKAAMEFIHTNAIPTRDFGQTKDGVLYMTQDFSPGKNLRKVLQEAGRLPTPRSLGAVRQALLALDEAHRKGIVHRDLKPENMLVEQDDAGDDWVRVCDFGIAKLLDHSGQEKGESLTGAQVIGTPHYMAPEQACGEPVDARTDVYAMGCVLYELLTGNKPFVANSAKDVLMKQISVPPVAPRERTPEAGIPVAVEQVVLKALNKTPGDRHASASAFIDAIDGLGIALPGRVHRTTGARRIPVDASLAETIAPGRPQRSSRVGAFLAAGTLCVIGLGVAALFVPPDVLPAQVRGLRDRVAVAVGLPASGGQQPVVIDVSTETRPQPVTETRPQPVTETRPQPVTETPLQTATETPLQTATETRPQPVTETRPQPVTETRPQPVTETRPQPVTETRPQPVTETRPQPVTETRPQPVTETRPQPVTETRPQPVTETRPQPVTETRPQPVTETRPQPVTETRPQPSTETIPDAQPWSPNTTTEEPVVTRVDPYAGPDPRTSRPPETGTERPPQPVTESTPGRVVDTGRTTRPSDGGAAGGATEAVEHTLHGTTIRLVRIPDQAVDINNRTVSVSGLWISADEVTVAQYAEFVQAHPDQQALREPLRRMLEAAGVRPPGGGTGRGRRPGQANDALDRIPEEYHGRPVRFVSHEIALAFAAWMRLRLPSPAEWLAAERSSSGRTAVPGAALEIRGMTQAPTEWTHNGGVAGVDGRSTVRPNGDPSDVGIRLAR